MKFRRTFLALALALAVMQSATAQGKRTEQAAEPKMVVASFTHDFGEVKAGTPLTHSFVLKNQGKADLLIKNVAPG